MDILEVSSCMVTVAEGVALFRFLCCDVWAVRRGRGDGLESSDTADPWTVCGSSSLAEDEALKESGGVTVPREEGVDILLGDLGDLRTV
jgi:hypothetical protein